MWLKLGRYEIQVVPAPLLASPRMVNLKQYGWCSISFVSCMHLHRPKRDFCLTLLPHCTVSIGTGTRFGA